MSLIIIGTVIALILLSAPLYGLQIEDGAGSGNRAKVSNTGLLEVEAVTVTEFEHVSEKNGDSYIWSSDAVNIDANDTVLLVKNTSAISLHITKIRITTSTNSEFTIHLPTTEVTVTGTSVTGVLINTTKAGAAASNAASDETNNTQGDVIGTAFLLANTTEELDFEGVIIAKNKSIAVDQVADAALAAVSIYGHYL